MCEFEMALKQPPADCALECSKNRTDNTACGNVHNGSTADIAMGGADPKPLPKCKRRSFDRDDVARLQL
jgi:hypothetical protein